MDAMSDRIDEVLSPTIERILSHPFLVELAQGSLPREVFGRYLSQNYLYLGSYAKALALLAARSSDAETIAFFSQRAAYTVESEQAFATDLMDAMGLDESMVRSATPSPACLAYGSFVKQAAALEPIPVALATLLPCYVVYNEVSKATLDEGSSDPHYQRWIEMYAGEEFEDGVTKARAALDAASLDSGEELIRRMIEQARYAGHYEWMFWESAYHDLDW